jgi:ABC-type branched-subunit amino acid transport system substrate-binding protein
VRRARRLAPRVAACVGVLVAVAGCSSSSSSKASTAQAIASGRTLAIYISEPAGIAADPTEQDTVDAEALAFDQLRGQVKDFGLALRYVRDPKLSDNARAAIENPSTIAYLGELAPGASEQSVGITNALDIPELSPTDNALELTEATPAVPGAPDSFYESLSTFGRTFARVVPSSALEARALAAEMQARGVHTLYVTDDGSDYGRALAYAVRGDARSRGIVLAGSEGSAGAIFYAGGLGRKALSFLENTASSAPHAALYVPSALADADLGSVLPASVTTRLTISSPGISARRLGAAGRRFLTTFTSDVRHAPAPEAIFGYAAMADLLYVLREAGGHANDREIVNRDLHRLSNPPDSVLGDYRIDRSGNTSLDSFVFLRLRGDSLLTLSSNRG